MTEFRREPTKSVEDRLARERPLPAAAFRGELRRQLLASASASPAPGRVRRAILAYSACGGFLLVVATAGVVGAGPLAA